MLCRSLICVKIGMSENEYSGGIVSYNSKILSTSLAMIYTFLILTSKINFKLKNVVKDINETPLLMDNIIGKWYKYYMSDLYMSKRLFSKYGKYFKPGEIIA